MNKNNQIPNKNIRTGIIIAILVIFLASAIYIAIAGKDNNFDANKTREKYEDRYYDDYYDDEDYDEEYDDDYDYDDYDDYDYDDNTEKELSITSHEVKNVYDYIKGYSYIPGLKDDFTCSSLTSEEKMKLVISSLYSKEKTLSEPLSAPSVEEITIDGRTYKASVPYKKFYQYEVTNMYSDIFGSSTDMNKETPLKYGYDVVYKYDETAYGYVEYVAVEQTAVNTSPNATLTKAVKKGKNLDLYVEIGNQTEQYSFEATTTYGNYKFTGRKTTQKNSL